MSSEDVWYKDGLRFECTRCGNCCTGEPGYVWVNDEEIATIARYLDEPLEETFAVYTRVVDTRRSLRERINGECVFWDRALGCTIYPVRPRQCRTFPFWESNLGSEADWEENCEFCPGSGQGPLIPVEEITKRMNVIKI
ncbi:MAG: YkgJ family cysteine cluster protein [Gemmataceae bacterium]